MWLRRFKYKYICSAFVASVMLIFYETCYDFSVDPEPISCGRYPGEKDVIIDNLVWQTLSLPNASSILFNAYLDDRENKTIVRVMLMSKGLNISTDEIYCQFWLDDDSKQTPIVVKATKFVKIWPKSK